MVKILIYYDVENFERWKKVFDANVDMRKSAGMLSSHIYREAEHPNSISLLMEWESEEKAKAFNALPAIREQRTTAGVIGTPMAFVLMPM